MLNSSFLVGWKKHGDMLHEMLIKFLGIVMIRNFGGATIIIDLVCACINLSTMKSWFFLFFQNTEGKASWNYRSPRNRWFSRQPPGAAPPKQPAHQDQPGEAPCYVLFRTVYLCIEGFIPVDCRVLYLLYLYMVGLFTCTW